MEQNTLIAELMVGSGDDPNGVFSSYNPNLIRFPMQIMMKSDDHNKLKKAIGQVVATSYDSAYMIVGDTAYVEYLPNGNAMLRAAPAGNWEIKIWQASRK